MLNRGMCTAIILLSTSSKSFLGLVCGLSKLLDWYLIICRMRSEMSSLFWMAHSFLQTLSTELCHFSATFFAEATVDFPPVRQRKWFHFTSIQEPSSENSEWRERPSGPDAVGRANVFAPVFLPREFNGWRSLGDYSPWDCNKLDMILRLNHHQVSTKVSYYDQYNRGNIKNKGEYNKNNKKGNGYGGVEQTGMA